jgi:hypothetical protein
MRTCRLNPIERAIRAVTVLCLRRFKPTPIRSATHVTH